MAILKCKMCGGELIVESDTNICECEYCGSKQTVPNLDDEKKVNLFTRANRLRLLCEFDKAFGVYESIIAEFPEEAEAYWGLILCKYGIEYVDDPKDGKKIPTCHRTSFESVMQDSDFEMVMEYSDGASRSIYREEAKKIEMIRAGIVEVSSKEEPYDIFICYKETAEDGQRTIDSVIAQDVYNALIEQGYKVFFSRITLEDKLGQEYEPYIFAALNSAKVMLVFGTDYEYFNAVWVKNEWKRFLSLIEKGEKKTLIPCYKDIDAYDMPKEFARLQAQDMGKVGAIQDLLRGVNKILEPTTQKNESGMIKLTEQGVFNGDALLKRGFMALEDNDWESASKFFDQVLNLDAENGQAYLGLAMCDWKICGIEKLKQDIIFFDTKSNKNFNRAMNYLEYDIKTMLRTVLEKNEDKKYKNSSSLSSKREENKKAEDIIVSPWLYIKTDGTVVSEYDNYKGWKNIKKIYDYYPRTIGIMMDGSVVTENLDKTGKDFEVNDLENIEEVVYLERGILAVRDNNGYIKVCKLEEGPNYRKPEEWALESVEKIKKMKRVYGSNTNCVILNLQNELIFTSERGDIVKTIENVKDFVKSDEEEIFCLKTDKTVSKIIYQDRIQEEKNYKNWNNILKIETNCKGYASGSCVIALKNDGTVKISGNIAAGDPWSNSIYEENIKFDVKKWDNITDISYNGIGCIVGLKMDGTVTATGFVTEDILQEISSWKDVVAIKIYDYCLLALTKEGKILHTNDDKFGTDFSFLENQKMFENFENIEGERKQHFERFLTQQRQEKEEKRKRLFEKIESLEKDISFSDQEIETSNNSKDEKEKKLNTLGIFSGREKKILRQEIEQQEQLVSNLKSKKDTLEKMLENYRKEFEKL